MDTAGYASHGQNSPNQEVAKQAGPEEALYDHANVPDHASDHDHGCQCASGLADRRSHKPSPGSKMDGCDDGVRPDRRMLNVIDGVVSKFRRAIGLVYAVSVGPVSIVDRSIHARVAPKMSPSNGLEPHAGVVLTPPCLTSNETDLYAYVLQGLVDVGAAKRAFEAVVERTPVLGARIRRDARVRSGSLVLEVKSSC